jgi:hypothetical protein
MGKPVEIRYSALLGTIIFWLVSHGTDGDIAGFSLDGLETLLASIPGDKLTEKDAGSVYSQMGEYSFRQLIAEFGGLTGVFRQIAVHKGLWTVDHTRRLFGLERWIDEPVAVTRPGKLAQAMKALKAAGTKGAAHSFPPVGEKVGRFRMEWTRLVGAFHAGYANEHDLYDHLLGPRPKLTHHGMQGFNALNLAMWGLHRGDLAENVAPIVERAWERVLEIELARGETETVVTPAAMAVGYAGGTSVLVRVLQAIGRDPKLQRTYSWGDGRKGKSAVFSHLIRATIPGSAETPEHFVRAVQDAGIDENALIAVAFYAPQWARFVHAAVGWPLFDEAVWWFHAHTKDEHWQILPSVREVWNAEIRKLTPLALEDLTEGAVDVDWFHRTHAALGEKRWSALDEFVKYASGGSGHKRAQLFADAMQGKLKKAELVKDIQEKRKQDAVRALGLLPLDKKSSAKDVLERYKLLHEFVRTSRQFGSQRQTSEKLAARIGQENLARTAGYADPIRLQWAMEGLATADLAGDGVTVNIEGVSVTLAINANGAPEITVKRGEKPLKTVPPAVKKNEAAHELFERKTELVRSASRMRQALELAMCRGDTFSGESLGELMGNVILRPILERVVFRGEGIAGYPVGGGKALRDQAGKIEPVKKGETLRLAHPVDLLAAREWTAWQRECFASERVQPFKQLFRELYVLTDQEKSDATFSHRYAGHQISARQALALLGSRGWVTAPEEGVFRTFHDEKLVAWIEFMETFHTPAEVEGLTLEKIRFARRGATEVMRLADVPPRLLSEVFRDVDLIASVAHRGAIDPEASASTVELRSALLRETLRLLKLENVKIKEPHIHIRGSLGEYSVHLGSATTHMMPGGTLVIVPVHSQHRGRVFLPFADDDPKTAEIVAKVILLARDAEIKDPNLLDQIRSIR